ncbi:DUF3800 domain-containing protein [Rhodoferax sp.]|uniref:DUF3800 domain-containing protein n=1 Tax=Rhodoferax sp. TaxID=50421 RepID=UPI002846DD93|nr:DUF3800 domain-containing protein [Rhodoferax sp.]MDR3368256.1 DUF3800 domain-containing protein [Rhodoferax sp.]
MEIDVNEMREMMVNAFQLRRVNDKFTFYYDETNNIRKFYLTDEGTNVPEHNNFVLGGIVLAEGQSLPDIAALRGKLGMQRNASEIKFGHVAKGDFEKVLTSKKLGTFLSWLVDHGIAIHYSSVNIIHWSIVDIIDSILAEDKFREYSPHHQYIKNELYRLANLDEPKFLALMKLHRYPDIQPGGVAAFMGSVNEFIADRNPKNNNLPALMLDAIVKKAASLSELAFLVHEEEGMLIDSFQGFYTRPIMLFKNSTHIFDRETEIEKSLKDTKFMDGSRHVDFCFSDSKAEPGIQIADVLTGFLGKYQSFVEEHSLPELLTRKKAWNAIQISNFELLRRLIDHSDEVSNAFIHRTTAMDSAWKDETFLHGLPAMPYLL